MFGHPIRNAIALVAPNCRFLNNDTYGCMVTRYGSFSKILEHMRIAVEIASFSHGDIDKCSINPEQCAYCSISCRVSPWKVGLSDWKSGVEEGSFSRITVSEGLKSPRVLPLLDR